jgi:acid stress-induced BolA-like protein IbaG/YrbA
MTPEQIQQMIQQGLPGARAEVLSDDNTHFEATVIAADFAGKRSLQRHQMVYRTLGEFMGREIHALSLRALTPEEAGPGRDG